MDYEPTTSGNKHQLTIKQHYHLKAILRRFANSAGRVKVVTKPFGTTSYLGLANQRFIGKRAWSQEFESAISWPIETAFLSEVEQLEAGAPIANHGAISDYHLLWALRHHFALNPLGEAEIYPGMSGQMDTELEELVESMHKVPFNNGRIAGRFHTTAALKELLKHPDNLSNYEGIKWNVIRSDSERFISADQYRDKLIMPLSPRLLLHASHELKSDRTVSAGDVTAYNAVSTEQAEHFTFG